MLLSAAKFLKIHNNFHNLSGVPFLHNTCVGYSSKVLEGVIEGGNTLEGVVGRCRGLQVFVRFW